MEKAQGSEANGSGSIDPDQQLSSLQEEIQSERKEKERQAKLAAEYLDTAKRV